MIGHSVTAIALAYTLVRSLNWLVGGDNEAPWRIWVGALLYLVARAAVDLWTHFHRANNSRKEHLP